MEQLTEECKKILGKNLLSIIEFGSEGKQTSVIIICKDLPFAIIERLKKTMREFMQRTGIVPLLSTKKELLRSTDVFPLELIDIKYPHRVLYGQDVLEKLSFKRAEVRREIEFELRSKLIHLRTQYLTAKNTKEINALMQAAVPTLMPLFYGLLFLKQTTVPVTLRELYGRVEELYHVDLRIFHAIRKREIVERDTKKNISDLIEVLETLINIIDTLKVR
ncbi:MAG: hypothetical protein V1725_05395 [archaeon]